MSNNSKMPIELKSKLIIQGEYLILGLAFVVVGILKLTGVFQTNNPIRFHIFICITIIGSLWLFIDLIWALVSKKRRQKVDLLDKFIMIPLAISIAIFDIYSFINWADGIPSFASYVIGTNFSYIGACYIFLAIFHWFIPSKMLLSVIEEDKKAELEESTPVTEIKDDDNAK